MSLKLSTQVSMLTHIPMTISWQRRGPEVREQKHTRSTVDNQSSCTSLQSWKAKHGGPAIPYISLTPKSMVALEGCFLALT